VVLVVLVVLVVVDVVDVVVVIKGGRSPPIKIKYFKQSYFINNR